MYERLLKLNILVINVKAGINTVLSILNLRFNFMARHEVTKNLFVAKKTN